MYISTTEHNHSYTKVSQTALYGKKVSETGELKVPVSTAHRLYDAELLALQLATWDYSNANQGTRWHLVSQWALWGWAV